MALCNQSASFIQTPCVANKFVSIHNAQILQPVSAMHIMYISRSVALTSAKGQSVSGKQNMSMPFSLKLLIHLYVIWYAAVALKQSVKQNLFPSIQ